MNQQEKKKNDNYSFIKSEANELVKHTAVKVILIFGGVYVLLYVSKFLINAAADSIRSIKNLKSAIKE